MKQLYKWGGVIPSVLILLLSLSVISCKTEDDPTVTPQKTAGSISYATASVSKTTADEAFTNTLTNTGDGTVSYASSKTDVAEVNTQTGLVTIKGAGETTITATVADSDTYTYATKTASYTLTVTAADTTPQKTAGSISYATTSVEKTTADEAFTNELTTTGDGTVSYASSKTDVAEVNATTGEVTIVGAGTTTITATVADSDTYTYATKTASYTLTVTQT
ncbi:MAG: Ig-like domain-containing protein, partial [Treponema sp.]|nr:Ig-like domain-containing protein [Treponema sp.]